MSTATDVNAQALTLAIEHRTRYDYSAPVTLAQHLAHLRPLDDEHQRLLAHDVSITPEASEQHAASDQRGNHALWFTVAKPHRQLEVVSRCELRVWPRFAALQAALSPAWDGLAERLRYVARAPYDPAVAYTLPSRFVPRLAELAAYAAPCLAPARPVAEAAIELMQRLHADFRYESASTQVDTPLAQAFAQRRGVCQDFAHLMIGALRMHGIPARYVSGYLLTHAPASAGGAGQAMLGADATHAWLQVYAPGTPGLPADGWLDLDPTNQLIPSAGHVRLAVGRDYGDVTPLRGVIRGGGQHRLNVAVHTRVLQPAAPAAPPATTATAATTATTGARALDAARRTA